MKAKRIHTYNHTHTPILLSPTPPFTYVRALAAKGWAHIYVNGISKWIQSVTEHLKTKKGEVQFLTWTETSSGWSSAVLGKMDLTGWTLASQLDQLSFCHITNYYMFCWVGICENLHRFSLSSIAVISPDSCVFKLLSGPLSVLISPSIWLSRYLLYLPVAQKNKAQPIHPFINPQTHLSTCLSLSEFGSSYLQNEAYHAVRLELTKHPSFSCGQYATAY